jgi:hypothetical protein
MALGRRISAYLPPPLKLWWQSDLEDASAFFAPEGYRSDSARKIATKLKAELLAFCT